MKPLEERFKDICNEYLCLFCKKHDVYDSGWVGGLVGGIIEISDCYFSLGDISLDIDLDALNEEKNSIWDWYWCNVESQENINYYSYLKGLRVDNFKKKVKSKKK